MLKSLKARLPHSTPVNRAILLAILSIGTASLAGKAVALAKEILVAGYFGTSDALDAFLIALLVPLFCIGVFAYSFPGALIPTLVQTRKLHGQAGGNRLLGNALTLALLLLAAVTLLLYLIGPVLVRLLASGFDADKLALTVSLYEQLLPLIILQGIGVFFATTIESEKKFILVALLPAVTPLCIALVLLGTGRQLGIDALVLGTLIGCGLEFMVLTGVLRARQVAVLPRWRGFDPATRQVLRQYLPVVAGAFMMTCTLLVDQAMAAWLGSGSVAALGYANKLISFMLGLTAVAVGKAVLPYFSEMTAERDWAGLRHTLHHYLRLILLASVPVVLGLVLLADEFVALLLERGAFGAADTARVGTILACYALQLPFYVAAILAVNLISSLRLNALLFYGSTLNLLVNIVLNYVFIQFFGVAGIALSTSVVYLVSAAFLLDRVTRALNRLQAADA